MTAPSPTAVVYSVAALGAILLLFTIFGDLRRSRTLATFGTLAIICFVPIAAPDRVGVAVAYGVAMLLGLVASGRNLKRIRLTIPFLLLIALMALQAVPKNSTENILLNLLYLGMMLTFASALSCLDASDLGDLATALGWLAAVFVFYALLEEFAGFPGLWPMRDAAGIDTNTIENRPNNLLPVLPGRAMVSFGHPLPFSLFLAFVGVLNWWKVLKGAQRRESLMFLGVVVVGFVLSGSRSTLLAFSAAAVVGLLVIHRFRASVTVPLSFIGLAAGVLSISTLFGNFTEVLGTVSYAHRLSMLAQTEVLLSRPPEEVLLGGGLVSPQELFESGIIDGGGIAVFDNQVLSTLAMYGLVGLGLVVWNILHVVRRKEPVSISVLILSMLMFFSFDTFQWPAAFVVFVAGIASGQVALRPGRQLVRTEAYI